MGEICFTVFCIFLGYFLWAFWVKKKDSIKGFQVKGWYGIFYAGSSMLLQWFRRRFDWRLKGERLEQMKKVYVGKKEEEIFYSYYGRLSCIFCAVVMGCLLFGAVSNLIPQESKLLNGYFLKKADVLGEDQTISLSANQNGKEKEVSVTVPKRKYTKAELEQKFQEAKEFVNRQYLGENSSAEEIEKPLNLIQVIPDSAVEVKWKLDSEGIIQEDGSIANDVLEENIQTEITVEFIYGEEKESMTKLLTILPCKKTKEALFWEQWQRQLERQQLESQSKEYLELPSSVHGESIRYSEKEISVSSIVLALLLLLPMLIILLEEEHLRKEVIRREKELQRDYPEFVEQFVLLIGAGLNIKETWKRIVSDYEKKKKEKHYVYEEMLVSVREMENGMSEARAYELFGKRTGLLQYMKFCTLIVQNLRKGSEDLLKLLDYEVADAFRERKENAKTLGEEAGTKLLLPMMLMLVVVFAIILYAAFYNM